LEDFLRKIEDLCKRCKNKNIITYTGFLTPTEREIIIKNFSNEKIIFFGGNDNSERVRAFFLPDYLDEIEKSDYITAFRADFSYKELTHRDFLGSILGVGIDRKCIGDIFVFGKEAYFFITKDISEYIKTNLNKVGSVGIKLREINFDEVKIIEPTFKEINFSVSSLRIDSILAGSIMESREKSVSYIKNGIVLLNYLPCENPSQKINENDIFSIKGYGKFKVAEIGGISRRGKTFVKVVKYI